MRAKKSYRPQKLFLRVIQYRLHYIIKFYLISLTGKYQFEIKSLSNYDSLRNETQI